MRNLFLAGAAALALATGATVVSAQAPATTAAPADTAAKPADPSWSPEYKAYYDTLTPTQKAGWWALTDAQRKQVYDLPPEQKIAAWTSIEQQIAAAAPTGAAATAAGQAAPPAAAATDPAAAGMPSSAEPADAMGANPADAAAPDASSPADQVQANPQGEGMPSATPPNPASADSLVPPTMPADPSYNAGPYKGALSAPPADAMNKDYPVCSRKIQDSCRNPGGK